MGDGCNLKSIYIYRACDDTMHAVQLCAMCGNGDRVMNAGWKTNAERIDTLGTKSES